MNNESVTAYEEPQLLSPLDEDEVILAALDRVRFAASFETVDTPIAKTQEMREQSKKELLALGYLDDEIDTAFDAIESSQSEYEYALQVLGLLM